jgi:hypothetical protein
MDSAYLAARWGGMVAIYCSEFTRRILRTLGIFDGPQGKLKGEVEEDGGPQPRGLELNPCCIMFRPTPGALIRLMSDQAIANFHPIPLRC